MILEKRLEVTLLGLNVQESSVVSVHPALMTLEEKLVVAFRNKETGWDASQVASCDAYMTLGKRLEVDLSDYKRQEPSVVASHHG